MNIRQQSTTNYPFLFLMTDSADHVTGKTGLTPTVTLSKNGAGFGAPSGAVTELALGWYALAGNATDRATLGELLLHASATGADPVDAKIFIVNFDPFAAPATAGAKMDIVDAPNATATAAFKTALAGLQVDLVNTPNATAVAAFKTGISGAKMDIVDAPNATATAAFKTALTGLQADLVNAPNATAVAAFKTGIAGAKMDIVDAPNATAVAAIKTGLAGLQADLVNAPNATAVAAIKTGLAGLQADLVNAPNATAVTAIQNGLVKLASTVDGVTVGNLLTCVLAVLAGQVEISGDQILFKKRDGVTAAVTLTVTEAGERTGSALA